MFGAVVGGGVDSVLWKTKWDSAENEGEEGGWNWLSVVGQRTPNTPTHPASKENSLPQVP